MKPTVDAVLPLVNAYYAIAGNGAGGSLHVVLDDGNIENAHVDWCIRWARDHGDDRGVLLGEVLAQMSKTQRRKLYRDGGRARPHPSEAEEAFDAVAAKVRAQ